MYTMPPASTGPFATQGIWYYIWLRPRWYRMYSLDPLSSHPQFWRKTIAPMLLTWYKLKERAFTRLNALIASMPRGRVLLNDGRCSIYHGNEFPKGLSRGNELKRIAAAVGLSRAYSRNQLDIRFKPHECMDKKQQTALRKLLGKIPY